MKRALMIIAAFVAAALITVAAQAEIKGGGVSNSETSVSQVEAHIQAH